MNHARYWLGLGCLAAICLTAVAAQGRADHIEKREYTIFINKKDAGRSWLRIVTKENGTEEMTGRADATVKFGPFTRYSYKAESTETWKDGRLIKLHTLVIESGKNAGASGA